MKILLVEDDKMYQSIIVSALQKECNSTVNVCGSDKQADLAVNQAFDVAVVDIFLGDGNGVDLVERHHQQFENKVIFFSDTDEEHTISRARSLGLFCDKKKPLSHLCDTVNSLYLSLRD